MSTLLVTLLIMDNQKIDTMQNRNQYGFSRAGQAENYKLGLISLCDSMTVVVKRSLIVNQIAAYNFRRVTCELLCVWVDCNCL